MIMKKCYSTVTHLKKSVLVINMDGMMVGMARAYIIGVM